MPLKAAGAGLHRAPVAGPCAGRFAEGLELCSTTPTICTPAPPATSSRMRCWSVPRGTRLVIASRTELDLPHGTLAENGSLLHLRGELDLAMSAAECAALVAGTGLDLSAQDVEALARRTDGWPAGVSLLTTAMAERGGPACPWATWGDGAERRAIPGGDSGLPIRERAQIPGLSFGARPVRAWPICHANAEAPPLGANDPPTRSRQRPDHGGGSARRAVPPESASPRNAQQDVRADDPDAVTRLHLRASEWYEHHGDLEAAIHHACEAGAIDRAGTLVGHALPDYVFSRRRRIGDLVRRSAGSASPGAPPLRAAGGFARCRRMEAATSGSRWR